MLRIVRSKARPLLHVMRCWSLVAPHLVEVRPLDRFLWLGKDLQNWARAAVGVWTECWALRL